MGVPFFDLKEQITEHHAELNAAMSSVIERGDFILGRAVSEFEAAFAEYCGVKHAIGISSGLDALAIALEGYGVGAGDEVILPANTFIATALAVSMVGATPVLVDIDPQYWHLDVDATKAAVTKKTKAILPVHLYGQPVDMSRISAIANERGIKVIEDACQAHGAYYNNRRCGGLGDAACFSFYPSKNLGAFGDGGMITTNDDDLAARCKQLRNYGSTKKYFHDSIGYNRRLDTLQAAVLNVKLPHLDRWNKHRVVMADFYTSHLSKLSAVQIPTVRQGCTHNYHLFIIAVEKRDTLQAHLTNMGIGTGIHYPVPIHLQNAYLNLGHTRNSFPVTEKYADQILSLPMWPEMNESHVTETCEAIARFVRQ